MLFLILHCKKEMEFKSHIEKTTTPFYVCSCNFSWRSLAEQVGYFYFHNEDCCYLLSDIVLGTLHALSQILMINLEGRYNCFIVEMRKIGFREVTLASKRQACYRKVPILFILPQCLPQKKRNCLGVRLSSGLGDLEQT